MKFSRRKAIEAFGAGALSPLAAEVLSAAQVPAAPKESKDTPKIAVGMGDGGVGGAGRGASAADRGAAARRIKQLGVDHVLSGGPQALPWTEQSLTAVMEPWKAAGVEVSNLMINLSTDILYGRTGNKRDEDIEKIKQSIVAAGKVGLPVVEYNFYAHRAMEGYFEEIDTARGGSSWTGFDYELVQTASQQYQTRPEEKGMKFKDLPPLPNEGAHNLDEMWNNITYFLRAVIPTAENANVRMALHPNDPPAPVSRGSQQIMGSVAGWKKLISIVNSPSNGITFDCGVTREMGEDPVEVCRYFASRDRINHVHFRNVQVIKPYERYREVWIDEGLNNMFAVMKELVKNKYSHLIYPEHFRRLDYDAERGPIPGYPGAGGYAAVAYNVGYTRAMLQAAMS
ncbi:MAG: mannonate dehydratase [Bryobacterales bacterium]|jgi:mannonate dehydratase|nr:mannonate dehydratase [Bryobacterales bacterium]